MANSEPSAPQSAGSEIDPWDADPRTFSNHLVFAPSEAAARLQAIHRRGESSTGRSLCAVDREVVAWLTRIAEDPQRGWRAPLWIRDTQLEAIEALRESVPNCRTLFEHFAALVRPAVQSGLPADIPKVLLVGPHGSGKGLAARLIADALGSFVAAVAGEAGAMDVALIGAKREDPGATIGWIARSLIEGCTDAPVLIIEDIDRPHRPLVHDFIVGEMPALFNALQERVMQDRLVDIGFAAGQVVWIATATSTATVPKSVLDLFDVIEIAEPAGDGRIALASAVTDRVLTQVPGHALAATARVDVLARLSRWTPSQMDRLYRAAVARALAQGRDAVTVFDLAVVERQPSDPWLTVPF